MAVDDKTETLFDTHAHLDFPDYDEDREAVMERARAVGVEYIVTIGSGAGIDSAERALALARGFDNVWATAGVHPHDAKLLEKDVLADIRELAADEKVVAIGEIGLDYAKMRSKKDVQRKGFRDQLAIARELDLPVIVHDRDAHLETMSILKEDGVPKAGGIMHCYAGDTRMARELIEMGFYISFPGVITFKNAAEMGKVAKAIPLERTLIETDCPFLTPVPFRGKRNEPAYVRYVAEAIAKLRNAPLKAVAQATTQNALDVYRVNP